MPRRARIGTDAWHGHVAVPGQVRPELWPSVDADALPDDRRAQLLRRKLGIQLYFEGATEADIRAACGYGRSHIYRLITESRGMSASACRLRGVTTPASVAVGLHCPSCRKPSALE